jgi:hypothetical protein
MFFSSFNGCAVLGCTNMGVGKSTYPLPANANVLSVTSRFSANPFPPPYFDISVLPAGGERKVMGRALALAGSGYVNLPTPHQHLQDLRRHLRPVC